MNLTAVLSKYVSYAFKQNYARKKNVILILGLA